MTKSLISNELKITLRDVILSSSWHGLPSVFRTKRLVLKIIWLIFFIISVLFCVFIIQGSVNNFFQNDVVTRIDLMRETESQFVTVTFCNINPKDTKYNLSETIIYCRYGSNENRCNLTEFKWTYVPIYGYCFSFNSGKDAFNQRIPVKNSSMRGYFFGLSIQFYIGSLNNTKISDEPLSGGFRIFIHNYTRNPDYNLGISVPIGFETRLSVKREFDQKLELPYNDCRSNLNTIDAFDSSIYKEMINLSMIYTQKECLNLIILKKIGKECNCDTDLFNLIELCSIKNITCLYRIYNSFYINYDYKTASKECPSECTTIDYKVSSSYADIDFKDFKSTINDSLTIGSKLNASALSYDFLKKSTLQVIVYYEDLSYTIVSQSAKMVPFDLVSNIGGLLGLFIGASFLSFVEFIEIILESIFICFENRKIKIGKK